MHIAIFADYYLPTLGGVQTSIKAQKESLEKAGHRVTIFCPLHEPSSDIDIIQLPTTKYFKPDDYPFTWSPQKAIDFAKKTIDSLGDVDVIHVHTEMVAAIAGILAAKSLNIPLVQSMHGRLDVYSKNVLPLPDLSSAVLLQLHQRYIHHDIKRITSSEPYAQSNTARRMWRIMVNQANCADHVIVPSQHFAKKLQRQGVVKPLTVLSNGIEQTVLHSITDTIPRSYSARENLKVMWCGRISHEKRPLEFLKAVRYFPQGVTVDMYGSGVAMNSAQRYINKYNLSGIVTLHGSVAQQTVLRAMQQHHVFVSSSYDFDNQPMVLLEAIATCLPVIYVDPDLAEIIPEKGSLRTRGHLAEDISAAIDEVTHNPDIIELMSRNLLAKRANIVQDHYTPQLINIYESICL